MHNASPVTPINYWRSCTEGVWWRCYIVSDIWFQDDLWEAFSLGFQSSFLKTWYLEKVLASVPCLGDAFGVCPSVLECCSAVWCSAHFKLLDREVIDARFQTRECLNVTLFIVDLWQYSVCCIRSCVTRCNLFMVLYLVCMCHCGLHAVLWLHIGILMRRPTTEPRNTAGLLFSSQWPSLTILLTPYSMVWDWRVSRAGLIFYWPKLLYTHYSLLLFFPFSSFCLSVGILGLWSSDWYGVYHSLSALHFRLSIIIILSSV